VGSTVVKVAIARGQLICSILTAISNSVASATLATISTSGEAIDYLVAHVSATLAVLVPTASAPLSTATPAAFTAAAAAATSCALLRSFLGLRRMRMEADVNGMLATRRSEFEHVTTDMRLVAEVEAVCTTCATIVPWALALIRASTSQHPPSAAANLFAAAQEAMALVIEVTKWMPLTTPLACSIANAAAVADTCVTVASSSPSPLVPSCLYALTFLGSVRSVPLSCLALPLAAAATLRPGFVATLPPKLQLHLFVCHVDALRRCSSILVPPTSSVAAVHAAAAAHTAAAAAASYVASLRTTTSLLPVSACAVVQSLLERSPTQTLRTPDAHVDDRWLDDAILSIELIASHCVAEMSSLLPQLFSILAIAADGWSSAITPPAVASASIAVTLVAATDGSTAVSMPSASEAEIGAVAVRDARKVGSDGDESSRFASLVALTVAATCDAVSDLSTASTVTAASLAVTTAAAATDAVGQALGPRSALLLRCLTAAELDGRTHLASDILSLLRLMAMLVPPEDLVPLLPVPVPSPQSMPLVTPTLPSGTATSAVESVAPRVVAALLPPLLQRLEQSTVDLNGLLGRVATLLLTLTGERRSLLLATTVDCLAVFVSSSNPSDADVFSATATTTSVTSSEVALQVRAASILASLLAHLLSSAMAATAPETTGTGATRPVAARAPASVAASKAPTEAQLPPSMAANAPNAPTARAAAALATGEGCAIAVAIVAAAPPAMSLQAMAILLQHESSPSRASRVPVAVDAMQTKLVEPLRLLQHMFVAAALRPSPEIANAVSFATRDSYVSADQVSADVTRRAAAAASHTVATAAASLFAALVAAAEVWVASMDVAREDRAHHVYAELWRTTQISLASVGQLGSGLDGAALLVPIGRMLQHSHQTIRKSGVELLSAQLSALLPDVGRTNTRSAASAYKIYGTAASTSPALPAAAVPHLVSLVSSLRPFLAPPAEGERGGSCAEHEAADLASVTIATPAQRWPLQQQQQMPTFAEASTAQAALLSIDVIAKALAAYEPAPFMACVGPTLNALRAADPNIAQPAALLLSTLISTLESHMLSILSELAPALLASMDNFFSSGLRAQAAASLATTLLSTTYPALLAAFPSMLGPHLPDLIARLVSIGTCHAPETIYAATASAALPSRTALTTGALAASIPSRLAAADAPPLIAARSSLLLAIAKAVPPRVLLKAVAEALPLLLKPPPSGIVQADGRSASCSSVGGDAGAPAAVASIFSLVGDHLTSRPCADAITHRAATFSLLLSALAYRETAGRETSTANAGASSVEAAAGRALVNLTTTLNEAQLKPLYLTALDWASEARPARISTTTIKPTLASPRLPRVIAFFALIAPSQIRFAALYSQYSALAMPLALATLATLAGTHSISDAVPCSVSSPVKRRKVSSFTEVSPMATTADADAAAIRLATFGVLRFLLASLPNHHRLSPVAAPEHLHQLQSLLPVALTAAAVAIASCSASPTGAASPTAATRSTAAVTHSITPDAPAMVITTASAADLVEVVILTIGSLAAAVGAEGVKVLHHLLCQAAQRDLQPPSTIYATASSSFVTSFSASAGSASATTATATVACDAFSAATQAATLSATSSVSASAFAASASAATVRRHALRGLASLYAALAEGAISLVAEALPVSSEAMEDGDASVRHAALDLMRTLEAISES